MAAPKGVDWLAVEGDYRAGALSLQAIADKWGCTEGSVRAAARKRGWLRDPAGVKAQRVKAATTGAVTDGVTSVTEMDAEVNRDIRVMRVAAGIFESVLDKIAGQIPTTSDPKDQKILVDTSATAAAMYRKIRNLEDKPGGRTVEDLLREL